jgi:phospholipase/carboxylesterase
MTKDKDHTKPGKFLLFLFLAALVCLGTGAAIYNARDIIFYDGPEAYLYGPRSKGDPKQLVIMVHPLGSSGHDVLTLAPPIANNLPDAAFIAVDGPTLWENGTEGMLYQWYERNDEIPEIMQVQVRASSAMLEKFIRRYALIFRIKYGITPDKIALFGYSQGATMALYTAPRLPFRIGAVAAIGGLMVENEDLSSSRFKKMPIQLIHGELDTVVLLSEHIRAQDTLEKAGFYVSGWVVKNGDHAIRPVSIAAAARFIRENLVEENRRESQ